MTIKNNSEILLINDCVNANPNGNPDAENSPRMDEDCEAVLVSDLRVKKNVRVNLGANGHDIFVSKEYDASTGKEKSVKAEDRVKSVGDVKSCIDVRLFGGVFPIKKENYSLTGPVQFEWGRSMHKCVVSDHGITTSFKTSDNGNDSVGSMGRDKRVDYALIATGGRINANSAVYTGLTEEDLVVFDNAMVNLFSEVNTRSKVGQTVRLYLRVETVKGKCLKRLSEYVSFVSDLGYPKELKDGYLEVNELVDYLLKKKDIITKIYVNLDDKISLKKNGEDVDFVSELKKIGVEVVSLEG